MRPTPGNVALDRAPLRAVASTQSYRRSDHDDLRPLFDRAKTNWRAGLYAALAALDLLVIVVVHALFQPGHRPSIDRYLVLDIALYGLLAVRIQGNGLLALRHPREGATRAAVAAATAPLVIGLLTLILDCPDVLPRALARETVTTAACLFFARRQLVAAIGWLVGRRFTNELILVDGAPSLPFVQRRVVTAAQIGIAPIASDPAMLDRIGCLLKHCDRVIIDAPLDRRACWLETLGGIDVDVEFIAAEFNDHRPFELRTIDGNFTLLMRRGALRPALRVRKRGFDIAVAATALLLLTPVMLALAVAIRRESPGPVLFRQRRVGLGNRHFTVLKFRTMRHGAIDRLGARSAARDDDRITRLGHFMRRTSLDELPQLFNVLAGDMSIVGPRPHALGSRAGTELFWEVDARYWDRHAVKPGMTGLAQIRGLRGATETTSDITLRLRADIEYMANWSLMGDVFILLRTVRVLVHHKAF